MSSTRLKTRGLLDYFVSIKDKHKDVVEVEIVEENEKKCNRNTKGKHQDKQTVNGFDVEVIEENEKKRKRNSKVKLQNKQTVKDVVEVEIVEENEKKRKINSVVKLQVKQKVVFEVELVKNENKRKRNNTVTLQEVKNSPNLNLTCVPVTRMKTRSSDLQSKKIEVSLPKSSEENSSEFEFEKLERRAKRKKQKNKIFRNKFLEEDSSDFEFEEFERKAKRRKKKNKTFRNSSLNGNREKDNNSEKRQKEKHKKALTKGKKVADSPNNVRDIMSYFGGKQKEIKIIDHAKLAFLQSGVPEAIVKAQKVVVMKKEEDEFLETVGFFPKFSHNITIETNSSTLSSDSIHWPFGLLPNQSNYSPSLDVLKFSSYVVGKNTPPPSDVFCCNMLEPSPKLSGVLNILDSTVNTLDSDEDEEDEEDTGLPWIEKYTVKRKKKLIIDKTSLHKFEGWLKRWKHDIGVDGGMSRKYIQKKRNSDSEDDFTTSEEEGEFKKKSVIMCGPTGCGKSALVYVLAKHLGFKVFEVNFSSRRSGKEVMQRVEEATLSHRLSDTADVDENHCLILFKDIDLIHGEEDEGFHAAVAQLISASVRPIVMTTCQPCSLDQKIEKTDPLWIYLSYPRPSLIVKKILLPIFQSETQDNEYEDIDLNYISSILESIVRHSSCDIRKSINQCQVFVSEKLFNTKKIHNHLLPLNDFEYISSRGMVIPPKSNSMSSTQSNKAEKRRINKELSHICETLELLADSDMISSFNTNDDILQGVDNQIRTSLKNNFEKILHINRRTMTNSFLNTQDFYQSLAFRNDSHIENEQKVYKLSEELSEYVDYIDDYDAKAYVRSIIKTSVLNSIGLLAKRNRRLKGYFNRVSPEFVKRICDTFDFQEKLEIIKAAEVTDVYS